MIRVVTCLYCKRTITLIDGRSQLPLICPDHPDGPMGCVPMTPADRMSSDTVGHMKGRALGHGRKRKR